MPRFPEDLDLACCSRVSPLARNGRYSQFNERLPTAYFRRAGDISLPISCILLRIPGLLEDYLQSETPDLAFSPESLLLLESFMTTHTVSELQAKLATAAARLQKSEERATAGQLSLELMHEIRNPLEALSHLIYLAFADADDPAKVCNHLRQAEEQIATLSQITSRTLGFARASQSPHPIDLVGVAEAALRIHQRTIEAKQVHLVKELPENLVAEVHTGEILQVISNVIVNALDALPPGGTLCLRLRERGGEIQFVIADNGHGIPKKHASEIFQPFFTTKEEHGTGLGLALSKNIVERHRGRIRVRSSDRPGKSGTIFKICLPA
jgi:signal transduction histidine kinase